MDWMRLSLERIWGVLGSDQRILSSSFTFAILSSRSDSVATGHV